MIYAPIRALDEAPPIAMSARRKRHAPPALDSDAGARLEAEPPGLARCPNVHTFPDVEPVPPCPRPVVRARGTARLCAIGMTPFRPNRARGLALMIGAGLCWSTGGLLVRSVETTEGWEIVFWRSLFMVVSLTMTLLVWHRGHTAAKFAAVGRWGVLTGCFLALTFFFYILSITRTTVANTLVIMSLAPLIAALMGWIMLRERIPGRTWAAMAAALAGMILMFADSLNGDGAIGMLIALGVPLAFTANVMVLRHNSGDIDMVPTVVIAGLISMALALPFAWPLTASVRDITVLAVMGVVQLGLGCMLMTLATRHLKAAEIGLLSLLETTLGPVWVWLWIGERPSDWALIGGLVVVGALALDALFGLVRERRAAVAD